MAEEAPPPQLEVESLSLNSYSPAPHALSLEERFKLIRSIGEECIQEEELMNLLDKKPQPVCYDGFEPSGRMHIAQISTGSMKIGPTVRIRIVPQLNNFDTKKP